MYVCGLDSGAMQNVGLCIDDDLTDTRNFFVIISCTVVGKEVLEDMPRGFRQGEIWEMRKR